MEAFDGAGGVLTTLVFGAVIGSFLNVCIYRIPLRSSVIRPPSSCPACGTAIRFYDNVPVLSYLLLRGRCRACAAPISIRYPIIEALTAGAAVAAWALDGWSPQLLVHFAFLAALIVISGIDLDHQIIPDVISLPGIALGLAASFLPGEPTWTASLAGLLAGGGVLWVVAEVYYRLTGREGMGGGDIKLLAMIGAFLGWRALPVTLLLSSLAGSLVGLAMIVFHGKDSRVPIPFGPFLAAAAAASLFSGDALLEWYVTLLAGD